MEFENIQNSLIFWPDPSSPPKINILSSIDTAAWEYRAIGQTMFPFALTGTHRSTSTSVSNLHRSLKTELPLPPKTHRSFPIATMLCRLRAAGFGSPGPIKISFHTPVAISQYQMSFHALSKYPPKRYNCNNQMQMQNQRPTRSE